MYLDHLTYLPDDILVKVDRASMAASLELRAPFLDHRVVELAWQVPMRLKLVEGSGKRILKHLLARYVPSELTDRPKQGFGVPIGAWLRGALRPWAEELLSEERLAADGLLEAAPIRRLWERHLEGGEDHGTALWHVLVFQHWLRHTR
jgi:asparagine synthase (glutamine-hydrolysing)